MKTLFRAEKGHMLIYNLTAGTNVKIAGNRLNELEYWLKTNEKTDIIDELDKNGFIDIEMSEKIKKQLAKTLNDCRKIESPLRSLHVPEIMNIELTDRCPLNCPQCYCDLNKGKDIDVEIAFRYIRNAANLKIPFINLSGGETMVYPHLNAILEYIRKKGLSSAIAVSGWGIDSKKIEELEKSGVNQIYVSLNGSTREINSKSRDGYEYAIKALELLNKSNYKNYYINWVARNDNVQDFQNVVVLAKKFGVKGIVILGLKPDADYVMQAALSKENFLMLADYLRKHDQCQLRIDVEPCFSELRAYINNYYLLNRNVGINKGCGAGRNAIAVDVNGNLIPCRHLLHPEKHENIESYWWESDLLDKLRRFEDNREDPCKDCYLKNNCISCRSVALKVEKDIFSGNRYCPVGVIEN